MEKLTEEREKITETVTKLSDEAGRIVLDRFKNPYILTFLISWIFFNWRPISFFILSSEKVETKIKFINNNYSDHWNYFIYPFAITILYLFALPYLNMVNEWCIKWSVKYRAEYAAEHLLNKIKNDTKIAIAEDKKQKAIADEKESGDTNKYIKELEDNLKNLQDTLSDERVRNLETIKKLEESNKKLSIDVSEAYNKVTDTTTFSNQSLRDNQNKINELEERLKSLDKEKNLIQIAYSNIVKENTFEKWIQNKIRRGESQLININGRKIFQGFFNGELYFFDLKTNLMISAVSVFTLLNDGDSIVVTDTKEVNEAVRKVNEYIKDNPPRK